MRLSPAVKDALHVTTDVGRCFGFCDLRRLPGLLCCCPRSEHDATLVSLGVVMYGGAGGV